MNNFAVLDDALAYSNGVYVYTHALIVNEELPEVLKITGDKNSIYDEGKIFSFVTERVPKDYKLYACKHYLDTYNSMWQIVHNLSRRAPMPKQVKKIFSQADQLARREAKKLLEQIIFQK